MCRIRRVLISGFISLPVVAVWVVTIQCVAIFDREEQLNGRSVSEWTNDLTSANENISKPAEDQIYHLSFHNDPVKRAWAIGSIWQANNIRVESVERIIECLSDNSELVQESSCNSLRMIVATKNYSQFSERFCSTLIKAALSHRHHIAYNNHIQLLHLLADCEPAFVRTLQVEITKLSNENKCDLLEIIAELGVKVKSMAPIIIDYQLSPDIHLSRAATVAMKSLK